MFQFFKSVGYAVKGFLISLKEQRNLKVQVVIALITVGAAGYFDISVAEWCVILLTIGLVIGLEMINTSIESLVDLVTLEQKPHAGKIKDIAAGAVLFASVLSIVIGVLIFRKYLMLE
jgi:diacylglycerol kinase